jgi:hypothetical protein
MTLLVKDANATVQWLATALDPSGSLVPVHAPAVTNAQRVSTPVGPANGLLVQNNPPAALRVSDVRAASAGGASIQIAANSGPFATTSGCKPGGSVSLFGATIGHAFAARRW